MAFIGDAEKALGIEILASDRKNLEGGIEGFQDEYGMKSKLVSPAVMMLSELGVGREEIFQNLLGVLKKLVVNEASTKDPEEAQEVFRRSFDDLMQNPELQAIPLAVLESMEDIEPKYLKQIAKSAPRGKPYVDCTLDLKRKVWISDVDIFRQEVTPVAHRLGTDPVLSGRVVQYTLVATTPAVEKSRRETNPDIKLINSYIGNNEKLLQSTLRIFRHRFMEKGNPAFCGAALDLILMAKTATGIDNSAKSARLGLDIVVECADLLSECLATQISKDQLATLRHIAERSVADGVDLVAMLLGSIPVVKTLCLNAYTHLEALRSGDAGDQLRENFESTEYLQDLSYIMHLSLTARDLMLEKRHVKASEEFIRAHWALIYWLVCEDYERELVADDAVLPDERVYGLAKISPLLQRLLCAYAINLYTRNDCVGVWRLRRPLEYIFVAAPVESHERHISEYLLQYISSDNAVPD